MVSPDFPFLPLVPLPSGHTTEIITSAEIRGGFLTTDRLGMTRIWDTEGILREVLPPEGIADFLVFPAVGGEYICGIGITGELKVYKCFDSEKGVQNGSKVPPIELYASGSFREGPITNWAEHVTSGFATRDAKEIYAGTSSGGIFHSTRTSPNEDFRGILHTLRSSDGFSCRGFTRNDAGDIFAILQNGQVEQLSASKSRTPRRSYIGGNLGMLKVTPDGSMFAGIRMTPGGVVSYGEQDEIVVCDAEGNVLHTFHAPYIGTIAIAKDNVIIASDEEGLLKYDFQTEDLAPLFDNDPWGEEFSVMSICILPIMECLVIGGVDHGMNNVVMQLWDWNGNRVAEDVRHLESLATLTPSLGSKGKYIIGTSSGGIWATGTNSISSQASQFFNLPNEAEIIQILPVKSTTALILANYIEKDLELEDNSGATWLVDFTRPEPIAELEVYEPLIGGWYDAETSIARLFSRGTYQEVLGTSFEVVEEGKSYPVDDPDFVASSIVREKRSQVWYAGTERGEVWRFEKNQESQKIIDRSHALGPIDSLALGPQEAPLLIAGFYRVIGIYWPQNRGFKKIYGLNSSINAMAPHPSLPLFAGGSVDGIIHIFDFNGNKIATLPPRHSRVITLLWTTSTKLLAGYASGEVGTWDLSSITIISGGSAKIMKVEKIEREGNV